MPDYKIRIIVEGVDNASGALNGVSGSLQRIGEFAAGGMLANGISSAMNALRGVAAEALQSYAAYERLSMSLNSLAAREALAAGSAKNMDDALAQTSGRTQELIGWIEKIAIQSPFSQTDVAAAFRMSMAYGFTTQEAQRYTKAMLDFAAGSGTSGYAMQRIGLALGQISARGKLASQELNQLSEAGMNARGAIADSMGISTEQLMAMTEKGLVPAEAAIKGIIEMMERDFGGAAQRQANTISGLLESLGDIKEITGRNLFEGAFKSLQPYVADFVGVFSSQEFQGGVKAAGAALGLGLTAGLDEAAASVQKMGAALEQIPQTAPPWVATLAALSAMPEAGISLKVTGDTTTIKMAEWFGNGGAITLDANMNVVDVQWDFGAGFTYDGSSLLYQGAPITIPSVLGGYMDYSKAVVAWANSFKIPLVGNITNLVALGQTITSWASGLTLSPHLVAYWSEQWWRQVKTVTANLSPNWTEDWWLNVKTVTANLSGLWDTEWWTETFNVVAKIMPDFGAFPGWLMDQLNGSGAAEATPARTPDYGSVTPGNINGRRKRAIGDSYFEGGLALVGEAGPELVELPRGTAIHTNSATQRLIKGYADGAGSGTTPLFGGLVTLLKAAGMWQEQKPESFGPSQNPYGWRTELLKPFQAAAADTATAFQAAAADSGQAMASKVSGALEGALRNAPGLFGTSQVTDQQMKLADLGVPQRFADSYLRELTDEVLNGVQRDNVDIKDAAKRAGIDPNLPAEAILELFKQAWEDSSLFANPANLDLIDQQAVQDSIARQQAQMAGQSNLMALFGINDENAKQQAEALGAGLAGMIGAASQSQAMQAAGGELAGAIAGGFADGGAASTGVTGLSTAVQTAAGLPENAKRLEAAGAVWIRAAWRGAVKEAKNLPAPDFGAALDNTNAVPPPANAGGGTGTGAQSTGRNDNAAQGRGSVVVTQTFVVNDQLMAERAARRSAQLLRRRN